MRLRSGLSDFEASLFLVEEKAENDEELEFKPVVVAENMFDVCL